MNRRYLTCLVVLCWMLSGCSLGGDPPAATATVAQPTTSAPTTVAHSAATAQPPPTPSTPPRASVTPTASSTPEPTLTRAPTPTVEPTLTAQPTATPPQAVDVPRITLERPVAGMFLGSPIDISGTVDVAGGQVRATVETPDGVPIGIEPVLLPTEPNGAGMNFRGTLTVGTAPTPRGIVVVVEYLDDAGDVVVAVQQRATIEGRFARLQYLTVEGPLPYSRPADATFLVYGAAAGPPAKVEVRLLDRNGSVLQSMEATLGWYQPGLPCDFAATIGNRPEGVLIEVISMQDDGTPLERRRVPLAAPDPS